MGLWATRTCTSCEPSRTLNMEPIPAVNTHSRRCGMVNINASISIVILGFFKRIVLKLIWYKNHWGKCECALSHERECECEWLFAPIMDYDEGCTAPSPDDCWYCLRSTLVFLYLCVRRWRTRHQRAGPASKVNPTYLNTTTTAFGTNDIEVQQWHHWQLDQSETQRLPWL